MQRMELESVKRERASLLQSLASLKADQGKSGRDLQSDDIRRLRKEMELKKDKVNELRQVQCPFLTGGCFGEATRL